MSTVYDHLSSMQLDGGEFPGAIEATTRWIAHDSFNESAHRRLMQSYFAAGDRNAALRAYHHCRKLFAEELHTRPAPETQALAERIRTQPLPPRLPALAAKKTPPIDSAAALPELPLTGRVQEYTRRFTRVYLPLPAHPICLRWNALPSILWRRWSSSPVTM
jgi:DNA-binding SARP family transcriptional activator